MGLADTFGIKKVDHTADITAVDPGLTVHAVALAMPLAVKSKAIKRRGIQEKLAAQASAALVTAASAHGHLGGPEGGIAYDIPREHDVLMLALTDRGLSLWDFGMMGVSKRPPELAFEAPRDAVASIEEQGRKTKGYTTVRLSFSDASYFDVKLVKATPEFFEALAAW